MDEKSKYFLSILIVIFFTSIVATVYRYWIQQDYLVQMQVDCDPIIESCFVSECDPAAEECSSIPEENIFYYKVFEKNAQSLPPCPFEGEACEEFVCDTSIGCRELLCNEGTLGDLGIEGPCTSPADFQDLEATEDVVEMEGAERSMQIEVPEGKVTEE